MTHHLPQAPSASSPASGQPRPVLKVAGLKERVGEIIELIRPAVQRDGGDIELVGVSEDGVVRIRLHGACVGCPSSMMTLKMGVERNLQENIPEVRSVVAVD